MSGKKTPIGPVGELARRNIKLRREELNLTYAELARRLTAAGRTIPVLGLARLEAGERRTDVDDLMALAEVLEVSVADLLGIDLADRPRGYQTPTPLATASEIAEFRRTTVAALAQERYRGDGPPFIKAGRSIRYRWADVEKWFDENTVTVDPESPC